ncbi:hypothetical protein SBADM41S_02661 [Streptomyces badius]
MRQALKELETEGLISRTRRRGTFIEPRARRVSPVRLLGSVDAIVAQQSGEATTVLGHGPVPLPGDLAEFFPDCAEVTRYRRLRRDNESDEPTNWAENAVRPDIAARIDVADLERWPMTKVLRDVVGVRISRITDTVEARLRPRHRRAAPGPAAQPDPALHGRDVRRGGSRGGRGPDPLPGRPVLLLRDGGSPLTPPPADAARRYDAKAHGGQGRDGSVAARRTAAAGSGGTRSPRRSTRSSPWTS